MGCDGERGGSKDADVIVGTKASVQPWWIVSKNSTAAGDQS